MPIQVLDLPNYGAAGAGQSTANMLGNGLQAILEHKIGQQQQKMTQQRFEQAGYPSHVAQLLSGYSPEDQVKLLQTLQMEEPEESQSGLDLLKPESRVKQNVEPQVQPKQQISKPKLKPPSFNKNQSQKMTAQQEKKQAESLAHVQKAYDRVKEILDTGYTGYSLTGISPEGRKLRSELDTLSEVFISNLIPLLNPKGTISKERFNYIKGLAPNSWDTDAAMKGKLEALRDIFGLGGERENNNGTIEMRDKSGQIYDIPEDMVEEARKAGLV